MAERGTLRSHHIELDGNVAVYFRFVAADHAEALHQGIEHELVDNLGNVRFGPLRAQTAEPLLERSRSVGVLLVANRLEFGLQLVHSGQPLVHVHHRGHAQDGLLCFGEVGRQRTDHLLLRSELVLEGLDHEVLVHRARTGSRRKVRLRFVVFAAVSVALTVPRGQRRLELFPIAVILQSAVVMGWNTTARVVVAGLTVWTELIVLDRMVLVVMGMVVGGGMEMAIVAVAVFE